VEQAYFPIYFLNLHEKNLIKKTTLESFKPRMKAKSWASLQSHSLRINSMRILQIPPFSGVVDT